MVKSLRKAKRTSLRYFFLNNQHHKVLRISRSEDLISAWNYVEHKRCTYVWSAAKNNMQRGFTMKEVSKIFERNPLVIHRYIQDGKIRKPARAYKIGDVTKESKFIFSEDDLRELHSYLLTVHRGRPRNDGTVTQSKLMSKAELEAIMKQDRILYTKDKSGEYVPVWKQPDW